MQLNEPNCVVNQVSTPIQVDITECHQMVTNVNIRERTEKNVSELSY